MQHALCKLKDLGALDRWQELALGLRLLESSHAPFEPRDFTVTDLGYSMSEFPLSPNLAKVRKLEKLV